MSAMTPYPNKKSVPNRKTRKSDRNKVFQANKKASRLAREARKVKLEEVIE